MALPAHAPSARTVTVRVRTLVITAGVLAALALMGWGVHWATSLQPLSAGATDTVPVGLDVPKQSALLQTGPPVYRWKSGGKYIVTLWFANTASVPITVTGVDHTTANWVGQFTGPTLGVGNERYPGRYTPFHPVRIPAGGTRLISAIFHANPRACEDPGGAGSVGSTDSVTFHFTTLGIVYDTQTIPLGDDAFYLTSPTKADCR